MPKEQLKGLGKSKSPNGLGKTSKCREHNKFKDMSYYDNVKGRISFLVRPFLCLKFSNRSDEITKVEQKQSDKQLFY
ncbi:hypothetical protein FMO003_35350 [Moritella sp. F3]|nr:hypothetical protein FMO001_20590 [Moritella sp. F1]GIC83255.1 hypothetical protein FMO003_35350 [Moritella sp. F3]